MADLRPDLPCPSGEALTAHAHGEGDGATRAAIARHLLACPTCHAEHDRDAGLFVALAALGAARGQPAPAQARGAPPPRTWTAWLPPVAAALLVGTALVLPAKPGGSRGDAVSPAPVAAMSAAHARLAPLLGAQAPDGHWAAETGPLGAQPCTSTAVVLLALLHASDGADLALRADTAVAWALERATGYLLDRLERPDRSLRDLPAAERAVLLAALARASDAVPSPRIDAATRALVSDLGRHVATSPPDAVSLPWLDYALAAAEKADVPGAAVVRDGLGLRDADDPWRAQEPARLPAAAPASAPGHAPACTPLRSALELLREEPPLRLLALGPACRSAPRLAQH